MIALHYGFNYLPQWMLAQQTTGIHWAIGHTMAVPRAVLEKIGGFKNFLNHLADDYELGNRVSQLGLRVIVPPLLLDCVVPAESFGEAFTRMQRWKRTIRRSRGTQFFGVIITYPVFWALILALLQPLAWWSWSALLGSDFDSLAARRRIAAGCENAGLAARVVAAAGRGCRGRNHFLRRVFRQHNYLGRPPLHAAPRWNLE